MARTMVGCQMRRFVFATVVLLGLTACSTQASVASSLQEEETRFRNESAIVGAGKTDAGDKPFDGEWGVAWCDKSSAESECGGFNLGLVQKGNRLCGTYDSARARLSQIDEGGRVLGTVMGDRAVITIESDRSGGMYVAHAMLDGHRLHWKLGKTIRKGERDIDIVAIDERLDRRPLEGDLALKHAETASDCRFQ